MCITTPRSWIKVVTALVAIGMTGCPHSTEDAAVGFVRRLGGRAPSIHRLDLAHTAIGDDDLQRLTQIGGASLAGVEQLDLTHTRITDRGVAMLRSFPKVKKLSLTLTGVSDAGVHSLAALEQLAELYLIETAVTDAALEPLSRLVHLRTLVLLRTDVTPAGISRLRQALPTALIQVDPAGGRTRRAQR